MTGSVGTAQNAATAEIAEPLTVLDEQTQQELQPPCQLRESGIDCADCAEWAVRAKCEHGGHISKPSLICDRHMRDALAGRAFWCGRCWRNTRPLIVSAERL